MSIFIITGAGASQDSGIQTYRGENGYYTKNAEQDLDFMNLYKAPDVIWGRLLPLYEQIVNHEPGPTYKKLAEIISQSKECMLVTQNIDGYSLHLHDIIDKETMILDVIELHGTYKTMSCITCMKTIEVTKEFIESHIKIPNCECGGTIRPDIVLYGEELDDRKTTKIFTYIKKKRPSTVYVIGTSLQFPYLRKMINSCKQLGAKVIHINPIQYCDNIFLTMRLYTSILYLLR